MSKKPLAEQVIVVTGASTGVGRAVRPRRGQARGERGVPIDSPDNLFETVPGDPGARGRFGEQSRPRTIWTTLRLHPRLATVLALLGIGMPAAVARVAQHTGHPGRLRRASRIG